MIADYSPEVTYEGDNTVMAQQSFNYLRKLLKKLEDGKIKEQGFFDYLNEISELCKMKCTASNPDYFLNLENIHTALKVKLSVRIG